MNKLLTVVVPVYKVEKYIRKCLDSLVLPVELRHKVEILVINDGTPDQSALIAKEYESEYPDMFRVVDKENGGHGSAWNRGVAEAQGKYISFLDSDDWLTNFKDFILKLDKNDTDLVFTNLVCVHQDSEKKDLFINRVMKPDVVYQVDEYDWKQSDQFYSGYNVTNFHVCTYKTDILKKHYPIFLEKAFYDDEILFVLPLCEARTFCFFDIILYNYLLGRPGQTMDKKVMIRNVDFKINVRKQCVDFVNKHRPQSKSVNDKLNRILESRCNDTLYLLTNLSRKSFKPKIKLFMQYISNNLIDYKPHNIFKCCKKFGTDITWILYNYVAPIYMKIKK